MRETCVNRQCPRPVLATVSGSCYKSQLNICSGTQNWLNSFLSGRSQLIDLEGTWSSPISSGNLGVIQGGPGSGFLFNLYINDLPSQVNRGIPATTTSHTTQQQYIDDGTLIVKGKTLNELKEKIGEEYLAVRKHLVNLRLVINDSKTQLMFITPKDKEDLNLTIGTSTIKHQSVIKILGLTISEDLKWDEHLWKGKGSVLRSIKTKTSLVRTLRPFINQQLLGQVGGAMINSTILYGAPLWGATTSHNKQIIQVAQTKAARAITTLWNKKGKIFHRQEILDKVNWPNVDQIITNSTLNLLKKATTNSTSAGLNKLFNTKQPNSKTRNNSIRINRENITTVSNNTFSSFAPELFNELPQHLKDPNLTNKQFKSKLKQHVKIHNKLDER